MNNNLQKDKISIIVPVYNAQDYLDECIYSLINQSYKNLEIILINDGSSDNSLEICKKFKKIDNRIILIDYKKNKGQAYARNRGLEVASGKYLGFVDSDDWIDVDMYDYLHYLIEKYEADCSFVKIRTKNFNYQSKKIKEKKYINDEILIEYLKYGMKSGEYSLCSYLFNKNQFKNIRFPENQINEDIPVIFKALDNAKVLVKSNKYSYNYRMTQNSTTRNKFRKKDLDLIKACKELENYSRNKSDEIKKLIKEKRDRSDFSLLAKIAYYGIEDGLDYNKEINQMKKNIRKNYFELLFSNMSILRKIQLTCFAINYDFSQKMIKIIRKISN